MMTKDDFAALKVDIKARGVIQPIIVTPKDEILDGRNRYAACEELKITPPVEVYKGTDPVGEVISRNILRRNLTDDQRVAIVAKLRGTEIQEEGKAAQRANLKKGAVKSAAAPKGSSKERVAKEAKVGTGKARAAIAAAKHDPKALDDVIAGKTKLAAAGKSAAAKKTEKDKAAGKVPKTKKELPLRTRVEKKWQRFMESFSVTDYKAVREIVRELVATADKKGHGG